MEERLNGIKFYVNNIKKNLSAVSPENEKENISESCGNILFLIAEIETLQKCGRLIG